MRDPHVVGTPLLAMTSLRASGTPASGPSCSPPARRSSALRPPPSAPPAAAVRAAPRPLACALVVDVQDRMHAAVDRRDAFEMGSGHLNSADVTAGHRDGDV